MDISMKAWTQELIKDQYPPLLAFFADFGFLTLRKHVDIMKGGMRNMLLTCPNYIIVEKKNFAWTMKNNF